MTLIANSVKFKLRRIKSENKLPPSSTNGSHPSSPVLITGSPDTPPHNWQSRHTPDCIPTGIPEIDAATAASPAEGSPRSWGRRLRDAPRCCIRFWRGRPSAKSSARWWTWRTPFPFTMPRTPGLPCQPVMGAMRPQCRTCPQGHRSADPGRRLRRRAEWDADGGESQLSIATKPAR